MRKTLQIANIIALLATLVINYLSNTGIFADSTMATVSAAYQNFFTPDGYAFSIWILIYVGLGAFVIYQSRGLFNAKPCPEEVGQIGWLFVLSCLLNSLWIIAWLYDYTGLSVLIMVGLLTTLVLIVYRTRMELDLVPLRKLALVWWPFAIYLGWVIVALVANVAAFLTKMNWNGFGIAESVWTIIMLAVAGLILIALTWTRNLRESSIAGVWGIVAVAAANWNDMRGIAYAAIAVAAITLVSTGLHGYRSRGRHFEEEAQMMQR
ncbi:tryptophan-rich sensory protein [Dyadobacter sandarakinus]|uniref:Tryptophan-rich sensory protein n=1 Tax=Dyadobacter sandarakinus TaxID=2747268 RepID=A0ABX7I4C2_9BACT|nr:tryptophan-rich sensory protein [Dyadobacter sandarakinus]QRR00625.1 tryptophan-rich sensory protein [Dyadobacter sandarakinus]